MPTTITNVTPTLADGVAIEIGEHHYKAGTVITITVEFSDPVFVNAPTDTPTLALNSGTSASYASGSGTDTLTFEYTIQDGDDTAQLAYTSTTALTLPDGTTIQNGADEDADLTLVTPGEANSLSGAVDTTIVVDTEAPSFDINPFFADPSLVLGLEPDDGASEAIAIYVFEFFNSTQSDNHTTAGTLTLDAFGNWEIGVPIGSAGDLILMQTEGMASGDVFPIGTTTNTFTLTDKAGNVASDLINVIISDSEPPVAIASGEIQPGEHENGDPIINYTVYLDEDGNATVNVMDLDNGSTDNDSRGIADYKIVTQPNTSFEVEVDQLTFTDDHLDTDVEVELRVYDPSGLTDEQLITLQIRDGTAPIAVAKSGLVLSLSSDEGNGSVSLTADAFDNGSSDNLGFIDSKAIASNRNTVEVDDSGALIFDSNDIGEHLVTLTVTDSSGNMGTVTETVTIEDNTAPTAQAQDITVELDSEGNATLSPTAVNNGSTDNTPIDSLSLSFIVNNAPVDSLSFTATDVDQVIPVVLQVEDVGGNTATADAVNVTVRDRLAPTVVPQNIEITLDGDGNATLSFAQVDGGSDDNVAIAADGKTLTYNGTTATTITFGPDDLGLKEVTLTVTDTSGNSNTGVAQVNIKESTPPTVMVQAHTAQLDESGLAIVSVDDIDNGSIDPTPGSGIDTRELQWDNGSGIVTGTELIFTGDDIGSQAVTLVVTDNHGNSALAVTTVIIQDTLAPTLFGVPTDIDQVEADRIPDAATVTATDNVDGTITPDFTEERINGDRPNSYTLIRTWTATDAQNNATTERQTITVTDTTAPTVVTQNITVQLDENGDAAIEAADVDDGSSDSVGAITLAVDPHTFTGDNLGSNTVTLTVTDEDGNSATGMATVTVEDVIDPMAIAQAHTVELNEFGVGSLTSADIDGGSTDNDVVVSLNADQTTFTLDDLGSNAVTLEVGDRAGNTSTAIATVTVVDNIAPEVMTQNLTIELDANGQATITADDIDNGSNDIAGIQSRTLSRTTFDGSHLGLNNQVILTVTDTNNNQATGTATVIVEDNLAPVLSGVPTDTSVEANEVPDPATVTAEDNVDGEVDVEFTETRVDGANPNAYTLTRTWRATDSRGNTTSDHQIISVGDTVLPEVKVQDITVSLDETGQVTITPEQIDNGSNDALGIASLELDITTFDQVGAFIVTLDVTDNSGNVASADATVTVIDDLAPVLSEDPGNITVEADAVPDAVTITAVDNVDGTVLVEFDELRTDGSSPNNYTLTRTWTATDTSGNEAIATQVVTVDDTTPPSVQTQDITIYLDANGQATIDASEIDNGSSDTVSDVTLSLNINSFDGTDLGENPVELTVTDEDGNSVMATAIVTVVDNLAPILSGVPANDSLEADTIPELATVTATITATDNVDGDVAVTANEVRTDGNSPNSYTLTRTWTATDNQGNSTSERQVISVGDTLAPTVITQDITVALDETGTASITASEIDNNSFDTVSDVTLTLDITSFDVNDLGSDNTVTLTVTDADGNSAMGTATVTVVDHLHPIAIAQDVTISLEGGVATLTPEQVDNGSSDNTGVITLALDETSFTSEGNYTVTLTVTDAAGNQSVADANIRVEENIPPVAVAQNITVGLDENGTVTITAADVDGGSTDNVGIVSSSISEDTFTVDDLGENEVTLTVKDAHDNSASATAIVTVIDALAPMIQTQNLELELNAVGTASITVEDIDAGSTDNVAIASSSLDITQFDADDLDAPTLVTLTVTDTSGNTASETALVTVVDRSNPIANAQNITLPLDANGVATLTAEALDGGSADNVAIASLTISQDTFTIDDLGANTVTLTVTDTSDNQSTDVATVTVVDVLQPTVVTQDTTIFLDETGIATLTVADIDGGSTDNGEITAMRLSQTRFTTAELGQTKSVTLALTDQSGNTASETAQVTIEDNLAPTVVTQDVILYLDENNQATLSPSLVNNGSFDNVAITNLSLDRTEFTADDLGVQTVTLTVTDNSGNQGTGTAQVSIEESGPPTPLSNQVFTLAENSPVETFVGSVLGQTFLGTLQNWRIEAPDFDQDSVPAVRIDTNTGVLRVTDADDLDFETNPTVTAFVTVFNGIEDSDPTAITLALTDQNEAPSLTLSDLYPRLSEALDTTTALKVADIAIADDGLGSNQLAIAGTDPELFEIQGSALYLKAGTVLDFDAKPLYSALVTVDDASIGNTPDDAVLFAIALDPATGLISGTTDVDTINASDSSLGNSSGNSLGASGDASTQNGETLTTSNTDSTDGTNGTLQPKATDDGSSSSGGSTGDTDNNDVIKGTKANDRLFGFGGNDRLRGKKGKDKLDGGDGDDVLIGQGQRDRLIGGSGDDTLIGGKDKDKLTGGAGSDTFVYRKIKDGRDTITDFTIGEDILDLSRVVRKIKGISETNLLGNSILLQKQGRNTIIQIDTDGLTGANEAIDLVKLKGVNPSNLNTNDFIF